MATKRTASEAGASTSSAPAPKKVAFQFEPVRIGLVSNLEEMNIKVLQFQNKKLAERIEHRRKAEDELKKRIEELEQRQTMDDAVMWIVNKYWNQLDEDVRVLLQRFDAEGFDESEEKSESNAVNSFLTLLSQWDNQESEERLQQRVEFSKRAIGKLLHAYDRLLQRNDDLRRALKKDLETEEVDVDDIMENKDEISVKKEKDIDIKKEIKQEKDDLQKDSDESSKMLGLEDIDVKKEPKSGDGTESEADLKDKIKQEDPPRPTITESILSEFDELQKENKRLHEQATELHQKHHSICIKNSELLAKLETTETEVAELTQKMEDLEYEKDNAKARVEKFERALSETMQKLQSYEEGPAMVKGGGEGVSKNKFEEIYHELEEQRELATTRLTELEKLQKDHQEALKEVERLKMDLSTLPKHVIVETTDYKVLQSQFSVLYNESMQLKTQVDDTKTTLQNSRNAQIRHIEQMEIAELEVQKQLRTELIQLEDQLAQVRRKYELLRIEYEQLMAANEQTGPVNREMRHLITSLKNNNEQLKGEVARFKRKLKEAQNELTKLKSEQMTKEMEVNENKFSEDEEVGSPESMEKSHPDEDVAQLKKEEEEEKDKEREKGKTDAEIIKELKAQLKKSQDSQKEMKLLLDMYKSAPKESRDKVQIMSAEKKARQEIDDLKGHISRLQEAERKERRKLAEEDAIKKIKIMEETITDLQKSISAQKQEEEALLNEMEVTGQAFEDMQEQNTRLLQQLKEKDDANFKLMSEQIKSNQIHKLLREEKERLAEQMAIVQQQVEAQNQVVYKLEEKESVLQSNLVSLEKELALRQQTCDLHKRKAVENAQTAADLKLHLEKYHGQLKEAQIAVADKTGALQQETYKHKRIMEDLASMRKKLERAKKIEMASSADEVLLEEIKEYKENLTCPSCKVKKKDAVLTKCFHVFCLDCLNTRYNTRQRKCPKCNATFGAKDYHRIYLT